MATTRIPRAGDPFSAKGETPGHGAADTRDELLAAAATAMRLLQSRQAHTPEQMLDGRERKVLKQLRNAIRAAS